MIRYQYLDELLSSKYKRYSMAEIAAKVNEKLSLDGCETVSLRCIQKDIKALEEEIFMVDLVREDINGKKCIHYADPSFSIFTKKLSKDEENLLSEVLSTIGQFDGLNNFEWLDALNSRLGINEQRKVIEFSTNPDYLANSNLLGSLFTAISNRQVLKVAYHTFALPDEHRMCIVHPYLLKQYNNRWFLIAGAEDETILTFALERIDSIEPQYEKQYIEASEDISERFDDIVGVTIYKDAPIETILFWVDSTQYPYIDTKPLHGSQRVIRGMRAEQLSEEYGLSDGYFIEIKCIINTELKQLIASFLDYVVVLSPKSLRDEITIRIENLLNKYTTRT